MRGDARSPGIYNRGTMPTVREILRVTGALALASVVAACATTKGPRRVPLDELPADYQLPENFSVVIYCQPFHVVFATAELS